MIAMMKLFSQKLTEALIGVVDSVDERVAVLEQLSEVCDDTRRRLDLIIA